MLDTLKPVISVDLDEVYVKRPCSCTSISGELSELSTKFEHCCSNMSIELSNIWKAIDDLSGKFNDISSQISGNDEPTLPPTIFAYSASDQEITAKIAEAGAWNTEPFPGFISSADTEMIEKLSAVLPFEFPEVVKIEDYNHVWTSESIAFGEINYCSYSEKMPVGYKYLSRNLISASYENNSLSAITTVEEPPFAGEISVSYKKRFHPTWPPYQFNFATSIMHTVKAKDGNKYWVEWYRDLNLEGHRIYMYEFGYEGVLRDYFVQYLELKYVVSSDTFDIIPHHDPTPPNI